MILLDTHALVWWAADAARLSARARRAIAAALREGHIAASAISLFEIAMAIRRGRLVLETPPEQWLTDLRLLPELRIEPVSSEIAEIAGSFDEKFPGDPADRIIAATAVALGLKLVTADARLGRAPQVQAVW
ncbi:MAG TPA: type II toxin-antitoxin system VapC family toxin [Burkholderiales bacterium]|nr:type II toxin-antitoxin system VapC family toxin [Burkholderiales bacterium]